MAKTDKFRERVRVARIMVDEGFTTVSESRDGQARKVKTPGHKARVYWQILRWSPGKLDVDGRKYDHVTVECLHEPVQIHCKGNQRWFCYHAMMALMTAAKYRGKRATLFQPSARLKAERYCNLVKGKVYACSSHTSGQLVFAVIWKGKPV